MAADIFPVSYTGLLPCPGIPVKNIRIKLSCKISLVLYNIGSVKYSGFPDHNSHKKIPKPPAKLTAAIKMILHKKLVTAD